MKAEIYVTLKDGVFDPQGMTLQTALDYLGFVGIENVRQGKFIEVELKENDKTKASTQIEEMCKKLLVSSVIENYKFKLGA